MKNYKEPNTDNWKGRISNADLYLHEIVKCIPFNENFDPKEKSIALLGYVCDEGVKRNQGRVGAKYGPDAIRKSLGKMPNHLSEKSQLFDLGNINCIKKDMEAAQESVAKVVSSVLQKQQFPVVLGGGHDIAYGHYQGIKSYLELNQKNKKIGIINFDAHFDLRQNINGNNSGTPFYQIAKECQTENIEFHYLCVGIRKDANDRSLFQTAKDLDVTFVLTDTFRLQFLEEINTWIHAFANSVDYIYVTIDLDGFSSAYAPGVSAPSPMGFTPQIVLECLKTIISTRKMISMDIAEMNPKFDIDERTSKLAASLIHYVIHTINKV
ncbi:MAG: formimidoylglutamase [Bacteroidota bacterium]